MAGLASEVRVQEEQPTVRRIASGATLRALGAGVTERGPVGTAKGPFASYSEWQKVYGGLTAVTLDSTEAVKGFFENGGTQLWWSRIVHTTTPGDPTSKTSAAGTLNVMTAASAATAGSVTSSAQPFNLEPGDDLDVSINGDPPQTFTFNATAAARESAAAPFALSNGQTLLIAIDGGAVLTKTFNTGEFVDIAAATVPEVVASLNAFFASQGAGAVATATSGGTKVTVTSNRRGTSSGVDVSGGAANGALGFALGNVAGGGNVPNIDAVTAADAQAVVAATLSGGTASVVGGALKITSTAVGAGSSVQVLASSTADDEFGFTNAVFGGTTGAAVATLRVDAKTDGAYAGDVRVTVANATSGESDRFNLYVEFKGALVERYFNVSLTTSDPNYVETLLNDPLTGSDYVTITDLTASPVNAPARGTFGPLTGGSNGLVGLADVDFSGGESLNGATGLRTFDAIDADVLIVPGRATSAVHNAMITYCEITRAGLLFAILDPPANQTAAQMLTYVTSTAALYELTEYAAIYWPRVKVANPSAALFGADPTVVVPPSGHIAGLYARNDARKIGGAFEQPAGVEFGIPHGVLGLEMEEVRKKAKRELVFPKNINPISQEDGTPIFVDGARVLKGSGNFPSVGQRRGVIFVEQRLIPGLAFMRHQNIKDRLYSEGQKSVTTFLLELTRNGAFKSLDPKKAFFVDFGPGLNPPSVQAQKTVYARIGLATSEPAEFIVLLVGPDTRALDEELAALAA